jgi:hypothetical protein
MEISANKGKNLQGAQVYRIGMRRRGAPQHGLYRWTRVAMWRQTT